jgi:hypothetical protein
VVERSGEVDQTAGTWWVDVGRFLNSFCRTTTTTLNHMILVSSLRSIHNGLMARR